MIRIIRMGECFDPEDFAVFDTVSDTFLVDENGDQYWSSPDEVAVDEASKRRIKNLVNNT